MRRFAAPLARLTAVTAVAGAALLLAAPAALAGGPTSVLLVSPTAQRTASLYHSNADYNRLLHALADNPVADEHAPALHGGPGTSAINLTWLIHDVQVWRVDRVFLDIDGPWVETVLGRGDNPRFFDNGVVHRPDNLTVVLEVLGKLGLVGDLPAKKTESPAQVPVAADQPAAERPLAAAGVTPEKSADPNWLWLLIGAAAGAMLVVGVRPVVGLVRMRAREAPPRT